jgi:RNA polymerase sigma-70 factor (ECF subfamily)
MSRRFPSDSSHLSSDADDSWRRFERLALRHLDAAHNLARWLTCNDDDACEVVQEAIRRAMHHVHDQRLEISRAWLLQIVRHTCISWLKEKRSLEIVALEEADDEWAGMATPSSDETPAVPEALASREQINAAIAGLPVAYREVLVLRELEDLSYGEIAGIADIPVGTVVSRLSRARSLIRAALMRPSTPRQLPPRPPHVQPR